MTNDELTHGRDLDLALTVASDIGRVIAATDSKIGFMLAAQSAVLAVMTQPLRSRTPVPAWTGPGMVSIGVVALVVMALLLAGLWPRTGGTARWVAFPTFPDAKPIRPRPALSRLADEAWSQVAALSAVARRKVRWFRAALVVGVIELVPLALWVTLGASPASTS